MKIAVASADGRTISPHFGRSPYFLVYTVDGVVVGKPEVRTLNSAPGKEDHQHGDGEHGAHDHSVFVRLLEDCETVISRGVGRRAAIELQQYGIRSCVVSVNMPPAQAVLACAGGNLKNAGKFCQCHEK